MRSWLVRMGMGGKKKAIVKRQKIKARVHYRNAERATTALAQHSMNLEGNRDGECNFSVSDGMFWAKRQTTKKGTKGFRRKRGKRHKKAAILCLQSPYKWSGLCVVSQGNNTLCTTLLHSLIYPWAARVPHLRVTSVHLRSRTWAGILPLSLLPLATVCRQQGVLQSLPQASQTTSETKNFFVYAHRGATASSCNSRRWFLLNSEVMDALIQLDGAREQTEY